MIIKVLGEVMKEEETQALCQYSKCGVTTSSAVSLYKDMVNLTGQDQVKIHSLHKCNKFQNMVKAVFSSFQPVGGHLQIEQTDS